MSVPRDSSGEFLLLNEKGTTVFFSGKKLGLVDAAEARLKRGSLFYLTSGPDKLVLLADLFGDNGKGSFVDWGPLRKEVTKDTRLKEFARSVEVLNTGEVVIRRPDNLSTTFYIAQLNSSRSAVVGYQELFFDFAYSQCLRSDLYIGLKENAVDTASLWTPTVFDKSGKAVSSFPGINVFSYYANSDANNLYLLSPDKRSIVFFGRDSTGKYDGNRKPGGLFRQDGLVSVYRILYGDEVGRYCVAVRNAKVMRGPGLSEPVARNLSTTVPLKILSIGKRELVDNVESFWYCVQGSDGSIGWILGRDIDIVYEPRSTDAKVNDSAVRLREAPSLQGKQIALLSKGIQVQLLEHTLDAQVIAGQKAFWHRVRTADGKTGWIFGQFLDLK